MVVGTGDTVMQLATSTFENTPARSTHRASGRFSIKVWAPEDRDTGTVSRFQASPHETAHTKEQPMKSAVMSIAVLGLAGLSAEAFSARVSEIVATEAVYMATISGSIDSVSKEDNTFVVATKGETSEKITVTVNDKTQYTLNGEPSTREEVLKTGANVSVTHTDKVASYVDAFTKE